MTFIHSDFINFSNFGFVEKVLKTSILVFKFSFIYEKL